MPTSEEDYQLSIELLDLYFLNISFLFIKNHSTFLSWCISYDPSIVKNEDFSWLITLKKYKQQKLMSPK